VRDATPADFDAVLALNHESVHFLSPMDPQRLQMLHREACYHRVAKIGGRVCAFLLAMREGSRYDSPNYRWFAAAYPRFLYIDRIVVGQPAQGHGLGRVFYDDLFAFARGIGAPLVACEIDSDPPNPVSQRFHERLGFREVGRQAVAGGSKTVSLQVTTQLQPRT
jgi:uncharacterized protein